LAVVEEECLPWDWYARASTNVILVRLSFLSVGSE